MKLYFPATILPNRDALPINAVYCRIALAASSHDMALTKEEADEAENVVVINVPDREFDVIDQLTTKESRERMAPVYQAIAIRKYISNLSDEEIYEILDNAGIEHEGFNTQMSPKP